MRLRTLEISQKPVGVSTAADWMASLRTNKSLINSIDLQYFLERRAVTWWPTADIAAFPSARSTEKETCQPFVTAMISEITTCCGHHVHRKSQLRMFGMSAYVQATELNVSCFTVNLSTGMQLSASLAVDASLSATAVKQEAGCAITVIGDVKGCGARSWDFPDDEVCHILDMATDLMTKEQFTRTFLFCLLTDGFRFQFLKCNLLCMVESLDGRY